MATERQSTDKTSVGVVGLGLLGAALAERLIGAGFDVRVWNRSPDKAAPLTAMGATWSDNPLAACDRVVVCLFAPTVVDEVLEHLSAGLHSGQIIVDATTGDPAHAEALGAKLAARGVAYLEAPIAASSAQTRKGEALAIVAGPRETYDASSDIFAAIAAKHRYAGPWGAASKIKLVNNLLLGLNRAALAEALIFAKSLGLDPATTLDVLRIGNAYSTVMDVKGRKMIEADFSTEAKLTQHAKDVRLILDEGRRTETLLPLSRLHLELLERGEADGLGDLDNSAIIRVIENLPPA